MLVTALQITTTISAHAPFISINFCSPSCSKLAMRSSICAISEESLLFISFNSACILCAFWISDCGIIRSPPADCNPSSAARILPMTSTPFRRSVSNLSPKKVSARLNFARTSPLPVTDQANQATHEPALLTNRPR